MPRSEDGAADHELSVATLILCRDLGQGSWTAQPVAWPSLLAYGSEAGAVDQLIALLEHALSESPPPTIARFALPADTSLGRLRAEVVIEQESRRRARTLLIDFAAVTLPQERDRWLVVPAIEHTFFVGRHEAEGFAAGEVSRIANLRSGEDDLRRVLPAYDEHIRPVTLRLALGKGGGAARALSRHKARLDAHRRASAIELLEQVARPLHRGIGAAPPQLIGRERHIQQLQASLSGARRDSVLLVGERGAGKSALFIDWWRKHRRSADRRGPVQVYATSAAQLLASMTSLGQWQERIADVVAAAELLDAVLYFDNFAELLSDRPERGGLDIAAMLRPAVVAGQLRVVGEITLAALDRAERRYPALFGAMHSIHIDPLDAAATRSAALARCRHWQRRDSQGVQVAPEAANVLVTLSERYLPYRAFPGKAMAVLDQLRKERTGAAEAGRVVTVSAEDVCGWFSRESGIPLSLLRDDLSLRRDDVVSALRKSMVGQRAAVERVADTLCVVKARLQPPGRPLCTFLFAGPTGVGKTQLARSLARYLFNDPQRMVRFDMSEYADPYAAQRLIAGSDDEVGLLTQKLRQQPFCVVLFDEIDKAHPTVHDMLLQVLGEGRLSDARGRTSYFHNAIIIMTSNLGASHDGSALGLLRQLSDDTQRYETAVRAAFRPELFNRLDRVIAFSPLSLSEVQEVVSLGLAAIVDRRGFQQLGIALELSDAAARWLAECGYSPSYGVRALRRAIETLLVAPLSALLAQLGDDARGCFVWVARPSEDFCAEHSARQRLLADVHGELRFELYRRPQASGRQALHGVALVAELRRQVDRMMVMDEAVHIFEQRDFVRAQLATFGRRKRKQAAVELAQLQRQHHLLDGAWSAAASLQADVHAAEQLCIGALFDGQQARSFADETETIFQQFLSSFFRLLTAERGDRNCCTMVAYQLDHPDVWQLWLSPFLDACDTRGWRVTAHVRGVQRQPDECWPDDRNWSPPRSADWLRMELAGEPTALRALLLRVEGRDAGLLVPLEAGLHRFVGFSKLVESVHLQLDLVSLHAEPLSDDAWRAPPLSEAPPPPAPFRGLTAARQITCRSSEVLVCGKERTVRVSHAEYFARLEEVVLSHYLHYLADDRADELYHEKLQRAVAAGLKTP